ncbi:NADPH-dependent FMN reductase family protein [Lutispora thermophila]|uniref:Multimeric flavodoxin WrbA n=1 Tax=Lutispora thermophila DSM 19022 TaxID=1122184 RepID=A0A1M6B6H5_9FIRM|nr:NAD(P)H-dependent oxidoreductase [Lutispora thermophila]SHI44354.1 Multimeric flavodoxin WrbA [Lutispora thermophila DSM 19022]
MKIAFIYGSPKAKYSASASLLQELKPLLEQDDIAISEYNFRKPLLNKEEIEQLINYDILVFAFPLYVDGIPSHLLNCLIQLESFFTSANKKDIKVYSIVNCGFYEGHQNKLAMEMMENWCSKAGLKWGQGLGIGGGGMMVMIKNVPMGQGPKKSLEEPFRQLANNILNGASGENIFVSPNIPRIFYKFAAEIGWRKSIKANGLKKKDLSARK